MFERTVRSLMRRMYTSDALVVPVDSSFGAEIMPVDLVFRPVKSFGGRIAGRNCFLVAPSEGPSDRAAAFVPRWLVR